MHGLGPPPQDRLSARELARAAGVLLLAGYALLRLARPRHWDLLDDVNLAVHEAGHVVFAAFGTTLQILGGSLLLLIVPAAFVVYFLRARQRYSAAITLGWVAQSLLNVSVYIGDARARLLPLLGGEGTIHDWRWLLRRWGLLAQDTQIARGVHLVAAILFVSAVAIAIANVRSDGTKEATDLPEAAVA